MFIVMLPTQRGENTKPLLKALCLALNYKGEVKNQAVLMHQFCFLFSGKLFEMTLCNQEIQFSFYLSSVTVFQIF